MDLTFVVPVLISFAVSVALGPVIIPFLRRLKMGQTERKEGVQSHLKKAGTPTHGRFDFSHRDDSDFTVFCQGLSEDCPGPVPYAGIWADRIFWMTT